MPPFNTIATTDSKRQNEQNGNKKPKEIMKLKPPTITIVVPPDGGWGWVVVVASFCSNTIVDGIVMSAGMFKDPID